MNVKTFDTGDQVRGSFRIHGCYSESWGHVEEPTITFTINLAGRNLEPPLGESEAICEGIKVLREEYEGLLAKKGEQKNV